MSDDETPNRQTYMVLSGERLKALRIELDLTQSEMAELLTLKDEPDVDVKTLYSWENGHTKLPHWVYYHMEMVVEECASREEQERTKEYIMKNKQSFIAAAFQRALQMAKKKL